MPVVAGCLVLIIVLLKKSQVLANLQRIDCTILWPFYDLHVSVNFRRFSCSYRLPYITFYDFHVSIDYHKNTFKDSRFLCSHRVPKKGFHDLYVLIDYHVLLL